MGRSFCCPLSVDIEGDTLHVWTDQALIPATLISSVSNDNGNPVLQWCSVPCEFTGTDEEITFTPDTSLGYVAVLVYEDGCEASDLYIVTDTSITESVNEYFNQINFSVFPQPAFSQITINADLAASNAVNVELFNIKGQLVFSQQFQANQKLQITIETSELPSGNYLLRLKSGSEILGMKKIVISR